MQTALRVAVEPGDFGGNEADVVDEFISGVSANFGEEFVEELVGRKVNVLLDGGQETVLAEFLLCLAVDLEQSVGEEEQHIVGFQGALADRVLRLLEQAERRTVPSVVRFQWLDHAPVSPQPQWTRMTG